MTVESLQSQLANSINAIYTDAVVKKINKDNFLDIYIPSINSSKGTHLYFNTSKDGIKIGFYVRDESFIKDVLLRAANSIEAASNGLRLIGNPKFDDVASAIAGALDFIADLEGTNNFSKASSLEDTDIKNQNTIERNSNTEILTQEKEIVQISESTIPQILELIESNKKLSNFKIIAYTSEYSDLTFWLKFKVNDSIIDVTRTNWSNDSYWNWQIDRNELIEGLTNYQKNKDTEELIYNYLNPYDEYEFDSVGNLDNGLNYEITDIQPELDNVPELLQDENGELDVFGLTNEILPIEEELSEREIGKISSYQIHINDQIFEFKLETVDEADESLHKDFINSLASFNSETMAMVQMFSRFGIREMGNGSGMWNGHFYTFDYTTYWDEGFLENSDAISVGNLIELVQSKILDSINQDDFDALYLGTVRNGNTTYDNFKWEDAVSKKDIQNAPSEEELCEEGDKLESEYSWESPERIEFVITEEGKEDLTYVLYSEISESSDETSDEQNVETNEDSLDTFNLSEFDVDDLELITNVATRIENEKVLTGLLYIPTKLVEMGFDEVENPFFFTSLVHVSEDEDPGFLLVNAAGFHSDCYTENEIKFIFSWDTLINIRIVEEDATSIKIELIKEDGSLLIHEPYSKNLKVLLSIYNSIWKDVVLRFAAESEYDWDVIQNDMGVSISTFDSQDEYVNWITEYNS